MSEELEFGFEESPSFEENPVLRPLSGETGHEGGSLSSHLNAGDAPHNDVSEFNFSAPPPIADYNEEEIGFVDIEDDLMGGNGGNKISEKELKAAEKEDRENIEQVAKWIVDVEDMFIIGFVKEKTKINLFKIKKTLEKYESDDETTELIVDSVEQFNKSIDSELNLSKSDKAALAKAWVEVLKDRPEIIDQMSPEVRLIITHAGIGLKIYRAQRNIKSVGDDITRNINKHFKELKAIQKENSDE